MKVDNALESLIDQVQKHQKYQNIHRSLVTRLSKEALHQGLKGKRAMKYVRNKLHQVGGAYFKQKVDYEQIKQDIQALPRDLNADKVKNFCLKTMGLHVSTAERLPILDTFFHNCFESISPVDSVLDLACGYNPLAIPWMPLPDAVHYHACDIYTDMLDVIDSFAKHFDLNFSTQPCDIIGFTSNKPVSLALLLKSIPCLEQVDKTIGSKILQSIDADYILVSFPVRAIGGQEKGMESFYRNHFYDLISDENWAVKEFLFDTELAFLVSK